MTRSDLLPLILVLLLPAVAIAADDDGAKAQTWVSADGGTHLLHGGHAMFAGDDAEIEKIDLSELRDGETRTFESSRGTIEVTREGDVVRLDGTGLRGHGARGVHALSCDVTTDECSLTIISAGDGHRAVMLRKGTGCDGDDCHATVSVGHAMHCDGDDCPSHVSSHNVVICRGDGDGDAACEDVEVEALHDLSTVVVETLGEGEVGEGRRVMIKTLGGHGRPHVIVERSDRVTLRCPEGDTTMSVANDRANEVFLCPEHSVPLEKVTSMTNSFVFEVQADDAGDGDSKEY